MRKLHLACAHLMPVLRGEVLISLTGHFLFNALAGVSSSVMQTPDNILKYQRLLGVFWSGVPCVCPARAVLLAGRWGAAGAVPAVPGHALHRLCGRRPADEKRLRWKSPRVKYLQRCLCSCTSKISFSQLVMLTVPFRFFNSLRAVLCLSVHSGRTLWKRDVCAEKCTKRKKQTQLFC